MANISALTFDIKEDGWEGSRGFTKREVPMSVLDERADPADATSVILKVLYAGICGSDRGIWYRTALKDMIHVIGRHIFGTWQISQRVLFCRSHRMIKRPSRRR